MKYVFDLASELSCGKYIKNKYIIDFSMAHSALKVLMTFGCMQCNVRDPEHKHDTRLPLEHAFLDYNRDLKRNYGIVTNTLDRENALCKIPILCDTVDRCYINRSIFMVYDSYVCVNIISQLLKLSEASAIFFFSQHMIACIIVGQMYVDICSVLESYCCVIFEETCTDSVDTQLVVVSSQYNGVEEKINLVGALASTTLGFRPSVFSRCWSCNSSAVACVCCIQDFFFTSGRGQGYGDDCVCDEVHCKCINMNDIPNYGDYYYVTDLPFSVTMDVHVSSYSLSESEFFYSVMNGFVFEDVVMTLEHGIVSSLSSISFVLFNGFIDEYDRFSRSQYLMNLYVSQLRFPNIVLSCDVFNNTSVKLIESTRDKYFVSFNLNYVDDVKALFLVLPCELSRSYFLEGLGISDSYGLWGLHFDRVRVKCMSYARKNCFCCNCSMSVRRDSPSTTFESTHLRVSRHGYSAYDSVQRYRPYDGGGELVVC